MVGYGRVFTIMAFVCGSLLADDAAPTKIANAVSEPTVQNDRLFEGSIRPDDPMQLLVFKLDRVSPGQKLRSSVLLKKLLKFAGEMGIIRINVQVYASDHTQS